MRQDKVRGQVQWLAVLRVLDESAVERPKERVQAKNDNTNNPFGWGYSVHGPEPWGVAFCALLRRGRVHWALTVQGWRRLWFRRMQVVLDRFARTHERGIVDKGSEMSWTITQIRRGPSLESSYHCGLASPRPQY